MAALITSVGALMLVGVWALIVFGWAGGADDAMRFAMTGTFGDSFAPVIGVLTAFALGATAASTYMQIVEMRESRQHAEQQAAAQDRANEIADEANELAIMGHMLAIMQQLADTEAFGVQITQWYGGREANASGQWADMVQKDDAGVSAEGTWRVNADVRSVLTRRRRLITLLKGLEQRMGGVTDKLRRKLVSAQLDQRT